VTATGRLRPARSTGPAARAAAARAAAARPATASTLPWQVRAALGSSMSRRKGRGGVSVPVTKAPIALRPVSETAIASAVPSFKPRPSYSPPSGSTPKSKPPQAPTAPWVSSWYITLASYA